MFVKCNYYVYKYTHIHVPGSILELSDADNISMHSFDDELCVICTLCVKYLGLYSAFKVYILISMFVPWEINP